jgi:hypothetical protein
VSRLPQLEAQLVAAAASSARRPRPSAPRRIAVGLIATAAAAAAVLLFAPRREEIPVVPAAAGVPAQTLALSRALTESAPPPLTERVAREQLPEVAAAAQARTPYPPGMGDAFDWAAPAAVVADTRRAVQQMVEYRAYCLWLRYWIAGSDRAGATAVLTDVPRWPTQRQTDPPEVEFQARIVAAAQAGDVAAIQHEVDLNCTSVVSATP